MRRSLLLIAAFLVSAWASERDGDFFQSQREPEPQAVEVPTYITLGVTVEPGRWLGPLVQHLTEGVESEFVRAKALHDWIALNIDYCTTDSAAGVASGDFSAALVTGRSACAGFSNLYAVMCSLAGIECRTVDGYTRDWGMDVFADEDPTVANHAWNAVRLGLDWRLVDPTWDAGRLRDGKFERVYSTDYLFSGPQTFGWTHFPKEPEWQLRNPVLTGEEFARQPNLRAEFHTLGLSLAEPLERVNEVQGLGTVELNVPEGVSVYGKLLGRDGEVILPRIEPDLSNGRAVIKARLPHPAERVLAIYASPDGRNSRHVAVAFFGFRRQE